jgi:hypothetical protein
MFHPLPTAPLEDVQKTDEVAVHVGARVFERIADARLGREVHDGVEPIFPEQPFHRLPVGEIRPDERKGGRKGDRF